MVVVGNVTAVHAKTRKMAILMDAAGHAVCPSTLGLAKENCCEPVRALHLYESSVLFEVRRRSLPGEFLLDIIQ